MAVILNAWFRCKWSIIIIAITIIIKWSIGKVYVSDSGQTRNFQVAVQISPRSFASKLEQIAYLLCARGNSDIYPRCDRKYVACKIQGEGLAWLIGMVVCLCAAIAGNGWPLNSPC